MGTSSHETSRFYTLGDSAAFTVKEKVFQLITGARVEYFFPVVKRADNTNALYLGLSYEPYIFINKGQSLNTYTYSRDMYVFNNVMAIVPRFTQNITKNVYLDINIPIAVYSIALKHDNWKNPILPIYLRRKTAVESTFLPANYQFRIGLGVKI